MRRKTIWSTGLAIALASFVLLPLLGHKLLTDWDEGIYAEVSREMLGGGWLVPHWNGQLWFEKPPLMLWITALFFRVFGVTEFWARAGSAFSGVVIVGVLHGWMARREGLLAAWIGTVALLSATGFLHVCRVGEMDVLLSLGCVVAMIGLIEVAEERTTGWYWFWTGFAVAAMTKGAASVVIPLTAGLLMMTEQWRLTRHFGWGTAMFAALVLPWHLAMWHMFGAAFLREYLGFHVLTRAAVAIEGHETPWWFYGKVLLVSAMPWVLVFPLAAWRGWRRAELRVWIVFVTLVTIFYSLVRTRLPHYVAPMYPAMAIVVAMFLAAEGGRVRRLDARRRWALAMVTALIWGGGLALTAGGRKRLHQAGGRGGWSVAEEREAVELVRHATRLGDQGPLLTWWVEPARSVATMVFYSRSVVEQVEAGEIDPASRRDRYMFDPHSLMRAVGTGERTILMERRLEVALPPELIFQATEAGPTMELGRIRPR